MDDPWADEDWWVEIEDVVPDGECGLYGEFGVQGAVPSRTEMTTCNLPKGHVGQHRRIGPLDGIGQQRFFELVAENIRLRSHIVQLQEFEEEHSPPNCIHSGFEQDCPSCWAGLLWRWTRAVLRGDEVVTTESADTVIGLGPSVGPVGAAGPSPSADA